MLDSVDAVLVITVRCLLQILHSLATVMHSVSLLATVVVI